MEDSGIDSEDRQSNLYDDLNIHHKSTTAVPTQHQHMDDLEVVFRNATNISNNGQSNFQGAQDTTSTPSTSDDSHSTRPLRSQPPNTCRVLQRKLELKVERAKRNYSQYREEQAKKSQSATLLPIHRLPIPGDTEQKPLVDYKSDNSDENEEISFFPAKRKGLKAMRNAELTDTFSIQEMTIESEEEAGNSDDSDASQNLELLPPLMKSNWLDRISKFITSCTSSLCS